MILNAVISSWKSGKLSGLFFISSRRWREIAPHPNKRKGWGGRKKPNNASNSEKITH
jgi:hypothetical protein